MNQEEIRKDYQDNMLKNIKWYASILSQEMPESAFHRLLLFLKNDVDLLMERRQFWKDHPIEENNLQDSRGNV